MGVAAFFLGSTFLSAGITDTLGEIFLDSGCPPGHCEGFAAFLSF